MHHSLKKIFTFSLLAIIFILPQTARAEINAKKVLDSINQQRSANNLPLLIDNAELTKAANLKAERIFKYQIFDHDLPMMPFFMPVTENHYQFDTVGENLAIDFDDTDSLISKWMNSRTHRQNIINRDFKDTGIAIKEGFMNGAPTKVVVQYFGQPKNNSGEKTETTKQEVATITFSTLAILGLSVLGMRKYF